jgi:two-component system phosphate regulon response regulator PhoB
MASVLIVEDDPDVQDVLRFNLQREGLDTIATDRGARALRLMLESPADLMLVDWMLPDISGLEVCREVRSQPTACNVPILIISARDQEHERVLGLESGADDYIVKPFSILEVILRVKRMLRTRSPAAADSLAEHGPVTVDESAHRAFVNGSEVYLTRTEFRLLAAFVSRPGRVLSRGHLLSQVWNARGDVMSRTVDTHIKRLREKLGGAGKLIATVRRVGYRYTPAGA